MFAYFCVEGCTFALHFSLVTPIDVIPECIIFVTYRPYALLVGYHVIHVRYSERYWYGITFTSFTFVLFVIF